MHKRQEFLKSTLSFINEINKNILVIVAMTMMTTSFVFLLFVINNVISMMISIAKVMYEEKTGTNPIEFNWFFQWAVANNVRLELSYLWRFFVCCIHSEYYSYKWFYYALIHFFFSSLALALALGAVEMGIILIEWTLYGFHSCTI